jgi:hypothetical protein
MANHSRRCVFAFLLICALLFLSSGTHAQSLLVDTGAPTNPAAGTSLDASGNQNCSPKPSCTQSFQFWAGQFTLTHAATISSAQGWMGPIFSGGAITVKLYADGGGIPGVAIFSQTYNLTSNFIDGWVPFAFSNPLPTLGAGTYWLAFEPVAFTATTGEGLSTNMDGGAPQPLAKYAVWNEFSVLNQFGNGYRAFGANIFSLGMRVLGTNFPDLAFGAVGRATMAGSTFGFPFSGDNVTGGVGTPSIFLGAGEIPAGWSLIRGSLFPNSLSTGSWSGASICFQSFSGCTQASGSGRSIVFRTFTNPTALSLTFSVNAVLDGGISNSGGTPGSAVGRVYVFDSTMFSNTLNASADPAQLLVSSVPVGQDLSGLFPAGAVLASASHTFTGPLNQVLATPLSTGLITVAAGQSITLMFDVTTITPAGNTVDFFSTLAPAAALFTDQNNNPVTQLVAVGAAVPAPASTTKLTLTPAIATNAVGTTQTVTVTATDSNNAAVPGAIVYFTIAAGGPNAGSPVPAITDGNGQATFTYTDAAGAGSDSIQANIGNLLSNSVQITWSVPGALNHLVISPATATITPGNSQPYTAQGFDVFNNSTGSVTAATTFTIAPDGSCTGATCTATVTGQHTVTGTDNGKTSQATLNVSSTADSTPPLVTVTFPAAPAGQAGYFKAGQTPIQGSVSATDPSNVVAISCSDSLSGVTLGALTGGGTGTASRILSVSGDGIHNITCTATDGASNTGAAAGSTTSATVKIDTTPPTVTYSGNAVTYTVDQTVNVTCSATDATSGVASSTCKNINGPAYSFSLGVNTFSATANDNAGNVGGGSTSFTVSVTYGSLINLVKLFEAKPLVQAQMVQTLQSAQGAAASGNAHLTDNLLAAFINQVEAQSGKSLTTVQAALLVRLAMALEM